MVDRASLIKHLEPRVRPTGTQVDAIRKALDKSVIELLLALPLYELQQLPTPIKADLIEMLALFDQKTTEKIAALWEPKRKLDAELKARIKKDLLPLIEGRRPVYEPVSASLAEARGALRSDVKAVIAAGAPLKDLKALAKKWDKQWKPSRDGRAAYEERLIALLDGAALAVKAGRS